MSTAKQPQSANLQQVLTDAATLLQKVQSDNRKAAARAAELEAALDRFETEAVGEEVAIDADIADYEAEALRALTAAANDLQDEELSN